MPHLIFDIVIIYFLQYLPCVEDTVLGIVVDCKADVSTSDVLYELLCLGSFLCSQLEFFPPPALLCINFGEGTGKIVIAIC